MPQTSLTERHFTAGDTVRDIVIGMSDGLTVPFALAAGLSGAVSSSGIIITAGLAEIAAGAIAMGLGGYRYVTNVPASGTNTPIQRSSHAFRALVLLRVIFRTIESFSVLEGQSSTVMTLIVEAKDATDKDIRFVSGRSDIRVVSRLHPYS